MIRVTLQHGSSSMPLPFYLAAEEWVARNMPAGEYFFTWSVVPTVICGRNQDIDTEVDLNYCREHAIDVVRRKSGGGCVYADGDNLMLSVIGPGASAQQALARFASIVERALLALGLDARATGRNDVLVDGRKVSGSACYQLASRSITHGTLLFSTNLENMTRAITPAKAKLESHKVKSVESRIGTLCHSLPQMAFCDFKEAIEGALTGGVVELGIDELDQVKSMAERYSDPQWLRIGRHSKAASGYAVDGVGHIAISATLTHGMVDAVDISGDFFCDGDLSALTESLCGAPATLQGLQAAIDRAPASISGLGSLSLAKMVLGAIDAQGMNR